jgi:hypothetical protein
MTQTVYWTIPDTISRFAQLPPVQIAGQPIPTTWASVGPDRARELGAVRHRRDELPDYYSIPDGVDPYTISEDEDGTRAHTLDLDQCNYDEVRAANAYAATIRVMRDKLLTACDWTQLAAAPLDAATKSAWTAYRQQLRDVPQQDGFPWGGNISNCPWPVTPDSGENEE